MEEEEEDSKWKTRSGRGEGERLEVYSVCRVEEEED